MIKRFKLFALLLIAAATMTTLFACNKDGNIDYGGQYRLYGLKIWQDGELVRDYVPVIADNGAPYLWDKVSKTLFASETDTPFWDSGAIGDRFDAGTVILVK